MNEVIDTHTAYSIVHTFHAHRLNNCFPSAYFVQRAMCCFKQRVLFRLVFVLV